MPFGFSHPKHSTYKYLLQHFFFNKGNFVNCFRDLRPFIRKTIRKCVAVIREYAKTQYHPLTNTCSVKQQQQNELKRHILTACSLGKHTLCLCDKLSIMWSFTLVAALIAFDIFDMQMYQSLKSGYRFGNIVYFRSIHRYIYTHIRK